jgi:L-lactate dehydrogenase complex protein LldF
MASLPIVNHARNAAEFISDEKETHRHDRALWFMRAKRDIAVQSLPEWESLREKASQIKSHCMSRLADYLEQFQDNATQLGVRVHWARDASHHNEIVYGILSERHVRKVVKSKSMLTEECHLNPFLEEHGIEVIDTDLGERIVQLRNEPPSHIVMPAVHLGREQIGATFHEHLGSKAGASDPNYLTDVACSHLREKFLGADAGITGVNFAIAETGGIVVCTNEGNADLGTSLPRLHIACMGIEKLIPRLRDLAVFQRLLARSTTGQPITVYSSHFHGPIPGGELHVVLVDNGRSRILGSNDFRRSLHCIRCSACLNTCPVFRRSGGYSYGSTISGPIGSTLSPSRDAGQFRTLPFACSLCGSCSDVCPVKIDLHNQLLVWRREIALRRLLPLSKRLAMTLASFVLRHTWLYETLGKVSRWSLRTLPRWMIYNRLNGWGRQRELPPIPKRSFRDLYKGSHDRSKRDS